MTDKTSLAKVYSSGKNGHMGRGSRPVTVNDKPLKDIEGIGFTWGYNGRREINLAHSIMVDYFEDPDVPRGLWMIFYDEVLSQYQPSDEWEITGQMISEWIYRRFNVGDDEETVDESPSEEIVGDRRKPLENVPMRVLPEQMQQEEKGAKSGDSVSAGTVGLNITPTIIERPEPKYVNTDEEFEDEFEDDEDFDDED